MFINQRLSDKEFFVLPALTTHFCGILFLCCLSMFVLWFAYLRTDRASWVDVGWSFNFTLVILYLMIAYISYSPSALGLAFMYLFWSLRLSGHILARLTGEGEDPRYETLKKKWSKQVQIKMLGFFLIQALLNVFFSLPLFLLWSDPQPEFTGLRKIATLVWLFSTWAEARADRQLERFRRRDGTSGKVCREGLWQYSRHPNYFFEWMIWVSYALFALESPMGWVALLCPAAMLFLLFRVTGIPATEAQALKSRGNDYKKYQATTSAFFPWFPKDNDKKK